MKKLVRFLSILCLCLVMIIPFSACEEQDSLQDGYYKGNGVVDKYKIEPSDDDAYITLLFRPDVILPYDHGIRGNCYSYFILRETTLDKFQCQNEQELLNNEFFRNTGYSTSLLYEIQNRQVRECLYKYETIYCILLYETRSTENGFDWANYVSVIYL